MNFKAMNMKKGLKRIWILGSVFWFVFPEFYFTDFKLLERTLAGAVSVGLWWVVWYLGLWVARGFVDDDDKKAGF